LTGVLQAEKLEVLRLTASTIWASRLDVVEHGRKKDDREKCEKPAKMSYHR
jgi:hypothetical protein